MDLARVGVPDRGKKMRFILAHERYGERAAAMPDEWVVLREEIARALLGDGLRLPMKPTSQKFVEIDLEKDSLADIEAKLDVLRKRLEAQGFMALD